jgi:hypothetical protein
VKFSKVKGPDSETRDSVGDCLKAASKGKCSWIRKLALEAGWRPDPPEKGWVRRQDAADLLGVGAPNFDKVYRDRLDKSRNMLRLGTQTWYRFAALLPIWLQVRGRSQKPADRALIQQALGLGGAGEEIELDQRTRKEKLQGDLLERKVGLLDRDLIQREDVHTVFGEVAGRLRQAGDVLEKQYGSEAGDLIRDAVDDAGRAIERALEEDGHE